MKLIQILFGFITFCAGVSALGMNTRLSLNGQSKTCYSITLKNETTASVMVGTKTIQPGESVKIFEQCPGSSISPHSIEVRLGSGFYFLPVPDPLDKDYHLVIRAGYEIIDTQFAQEQAEEHTLFSSPPPPTKTKQISPPTSFNAPTSYILPTTQDTEKPAHYRSGTASNAEASAEASIVH